LEKRAKIQEENIKNNEKDIRKIPEPLANKMLTKKK